MLMVIRPATAADIPVMMALASRTATAAQWSAADYERLFSPGSVQRHCLVLEENSAVQAFLGELEAFYPQAVIYRGPAEVK